MSIKISEEQLTKFQKIYEEAFGRSIPRKLAYAQALKLINLAKATIDHAMKTSKSQGSESLEDNIDNI